MTFHQRVLQDKKTKRQGQTFIEFIFLLLMTFILSLSLLQGINAGIANYWVGIVNKIVAPSSVELR